MSVLDAGDGKGLQTINCALYPNAPNGNTPNSLSLTPDGQMLFVANADANNLAVFNVAEPGNAKPLGFIPTGWYPTSVRYNPLDKRLYVANGKGLDAEGQPAGPEPDLPPDRRPSREYIAGLYRGTLGIIDLPTPEQMAALQQAGLRVQPAARDRGVDRPTCPTDNPIPRKVGEPSPIKYCIYIIKENRTYDQVFGDMKEGNGDPNLCLFPEKITPNHHKLAREFVLLDNFYVDGEVSADGHEWSMGAYATDFVEKVWPLSYRGSPTEEARRLPGRGRLRRDRPAGRRLHLGPLRRGRASATAATASGSTTARRPTDPGQGRASRRWRATSTRSSAASTSTTPTQKRADRFIEELKRFEKEGEHAAAADRAPAQRPHLRHPRRQADADGRWSPTTTWPWAGSSRRCQQEQVLEGDGDLRHRGRRPERPRPRGRPPHGRPGRQSRTRKRGHVDSTMYSTSSMLRTMELILGLKPMSQFDAAARPMYHVVPGEAGPDAVHARRAEGGPEGEEQGDGVGGEAVGEVRLLAKEDAADDLLFNEVIWRSVKGPDSPMPPPVRAAFVFPHLDKDD